ncbi:septum formation initiator family protein [Neobacillus notoginsengisoli]|uniref:Septum formation initiator family protein n=1 Tax=Neobacillus notoginsengisoli TaxID=1578198 RepID=A0A417YGB7_9BACI|nr:septum formation initiator family protein [Neobacillus notoginsengisoli]RHW31815.1 septum formation initiator family protein [Neobacillus notoginsengisoli]
MGAPKKRNVARIHNEYTESKYYTEEAASIKRSLLVRRLAAFSLLAVLFAFFTISSIYSRAEVLEEKREEKKMLEQKLSGLNREQDILKEEILKLNDDEYIVKLARKEYFLSDKGEIIFSLPEDNKKGK